VTLQTAQTQLYVPRRDIAKRQMFIDTNFFSKRRMGQARVETDTVWSVVAEFGKELLYS
jgi:hypothetical protein